MARIIGSSITATGRLPRVTFYNTEKASAAASGQVSNLLVVPRFSLQMPIVHRVVEESFPGSAGRVAVQSNMMQAVFLGAT